MIEITSFRFVTTGVWGYKFYDEQHNELGSVKADVLPSQPLQISAKGIDWYSSFDMSHMVVPGICRYVKNRQNGQEVYRVIFCESDLYQVSTSDNRTIQVEKRDENLLFGKPGEPAIAVSKRIREARWRPRIGYCDVQPYFSTVFYEDVNLEYMMMVLSFPSLKIG